MNIVVIDGYTTMQDDLSWEELETLGNVTVYERTHPEETIERCLNAEAVLTNKVVFNEEVMSQLPRLQYIGVTGTGYNVVDTEAAHRRGIVVTNVPAYSTNGVAQMVFAHLLNATLPVDHYAREDRQGRWSRSEDFCWVDTPLTELAGLTMGIVGLGNIGMAVARIANAFGMRVIAQTSKTREQLPSYIIKVSQEELFRECDILSLHCPLTEETRGMVRKDTINQMKRGVIIINTGRGPLIVEEDMAEALNNGKVTAFCADVLAQEPPQADNSLLHCPNAYITPHIAWASRAARERLIHVVTENLKAFLEGRKINRV